jgi:hypothetical protein
MRLRDFLKATTLMSLTLITGLGNRLPPALLERTECEDDYLKAGTPPRAALPTPPETVFQDKVLESVYYNTLFILSTSNRCSDFFGGSAPAMQVFNQLMGQVRKDALASTVAMRMNGYTTNGEDARTGARYRLFSKVSINTNGPFYKKKTFNSERSVFGVGSFGPNTREVRLLILLHELGHVMRGPDGNWLLPDDGGNEEISRNNSRKIEEVCGDQIKGLGNDDAWKNLALRNHPGEKLARDNNHPESPLERAGNH